MDDSLFLKEHFGRWAQDNDIIIGSGAKSGSFLLSQIVYLLRFGGKDDFQRLFDVSHCPDVLQYPEHSVEERIKDLNKMRETVGVGPKQRMQWYTHTSPASKHLFGSQPDLNPNIKYISVIRHGKEVLRSMSYFMDAHEKQMRDMWGGFPMKVCVCVCVCVCVFCP